MSRDFVNLEDLVRHLRVNEVNSMVDGCEEGLVVVVVVVAGLGSLCSRSPIRRDRYVHCVPIVHLFVSLRD